MKAIVLTICGIFFISVCKAQDDSEPCKEMLKGGLYRTYLKTQSNNFEQDLKSYFLSESFKSDAKSGKWSGGLSAVVDAVPLELSGNASEDKVKTFQEKIRKGSTFKIDQQSYDFLATSIPDAELAKTYSDCVIQTRKKGLRLSVSASGKVAQFTLHYAKEFDTDPSPKVKQIDVRGGKIVSTNLAVGQTLLNYNNIVCERDVNQDLFLTITTDRGIAVHRLPAEPSGFNKDLPIGTVISSYLDWGSFQKITSNNSGNPGGDNWSPQYSKWAPADGRDIPNSMLARTIVPQPARTPDLRGMFLRGFNQFDPLEASGVSAEQRDPDTRARGAMQQDAIRTHKHSITARRYFSSEPTANSELKAGLTAGSLFRDGGASGISRELLNETGAPVTGEAQETRPKNLAIFYYIRIN